MGNFIFAFISTIVSGSILYTAYRLLISLPVQKEMEDERVRAEADKALADAYRDDYDKIHYKF